MNTTKLERCKSEVEYYLRKAPWKDLENVVSVEHHGWRKPWSDDGVMMGISEVKGKCLWCLE